MIAHFHRLVEPIAALITAFRCRRLPRWGGGEAAWLGVLKVAEENPDSLRWQLIAAVGTRRTGESFRDFDLRRATAIDLVDPWTPPA